ncbi:MAG: hypothetical protein RLZZ367_996, partial [Bacteroidota bacterium]
MIAIYGKTFSKNNAPFAQELFDYMDLKGMKYVVEEKFLQLMRNEMQLRISADTFTCFKDIKNSTEVVFSMGGDGTILES